MKILFYGIAQMEDKEAKAKETLIYLNNLKVAIPAHAGIQRLQELMDARFREHDE